MANKTLMIVDDSKVSRMMIMSMIKDKESDWDMIEAANGDEAITKSANKSIDFFSVDLNMPGMDGLTVIETLTPNFPAAKMVLLTANIQDTTHEKASALGAICVNKPITEASINQVLEYFRDPPAA